MLGYTNKWISVPPNFAPARDLALAAPCAAITKRAHFVTRKPMKAIEYLNKVRMAHTEQGSYVLTILSPVAPALTPEGELPLGCHFAV
jgi:hypothetical protein